MVGVLLLALAAGGLLLRRDSAPSLVPGTTHRVAFEEALELEAQVQARCMQTRDFHRAYEAFANKRTPEFQGD